MTLPDTVINAALEYSGHVYGHESNLSILKNHFNKDVKSVIEAIRIGPECIQYGLLMYLRFDCGVEAWGESTSDRNSLVYKVKINDNSDYEYIYPINKRDIRSEFLAMGLKYDGNTLISTNLQHPSATNNE